MRVEPVGENTLVGAAKLTRAREDAAAVYKNRQVEGLAVFEGERLAREFGGTVKRDGRGGGKFFRDTGGANAFGSRAGGGKAKRIGMGFDGQARERRDRIHAARAQ